MTTLEAVIFDMDGVLILSGPAHCRSWLDATAALGLPMTEADFTRTFGMRNRDIVATLWPDRMDPDGDDARTLANEKERRYRDLIRAAPPLAPGCLDVVRGLADAGLRLAVASSAPRENIDLIVEASGLDALMHATVSGEECARGKPHPDCFLKAASLINVDPARAAVVEDAVHGVEAAVAGGMRAVGVTTTTDEASLRGAGATHVTSDLIEAGRHLRATARCVG